MASAGVSKKNLEFLNNHFLLCLTGNKQTETHELENKLLTEIIPF